MKHFASFRHRAAQGGRIDSCSKLHAVAVTRTLELICGKIRTFLLDGSQALL